MKKKVFLALAGIVLLIAVLGGIKFLQINRMIAQGNQFVPPPTTVTAATVERTTWETTLTAVGSLEAVQGVTITAELGGKVTAIAFDPGAYVAAGDLLVQQDISSEEAQLRSDQATLALKKADHDRAKELLSQQVVTQAAYDQALAEYKQALAAIDNNRALIAKKTIRAPFAGRLGIRLINLGQNLEGGEPIVSLQAMDPIFVNFLVPQNQIAQVQLGLTVRVATDALTGEVLEGQITAINPQVEEATRNIRIQATVENQSERLRPGMFVNVGVVLPEQDTVLVIPATAVLFAPYSDSVFVVEPQEGDTPQNALALRQQFVQLGEKRGDFIAVQKGLAAGQTVVSTGVFKLRNGMPVVVDNTLAPKFELAPRPENA
ncbi:MAG: efflux RND transporter periplasmic adaptor subunit [Desulfobacterales bacterium]|jgi:membrane fusion protein (multidrug efflux system)